MCVIIAKPAGSYIDYGTLEKCWYINDDGGGVAWAEDGKLHVKKGFMSFDDFGKFWFSRDWGDISVLLHFRIATSGIINKKNTHPFWVVRNDLVFAHNGVFSSLGEANISDTIVFNREVLQRLPDDFVESPTIMGMLEKYCGFGSKLAFLNSDGRFAFVNERYGDWEPDGCWYSNLNHKFRWYSKKNTCSPWHPDDVDFEMYNVSGYVVDDIGPFEQTQDRQTMINILGNDTWYCHSCQYQFDVQEVIDVAVECDGLILPKCPCCDKQDGVFCWNDEENEYYKSKNNDDDDEIIDVESEEL